MGWRRAASVFLSRISLASKSPIPIPFANSRPSYSFHSPNPVFRFRCLRSFSAVASPISFVANQFESEVDHSYDFEPEDDDEIGKIPIKAYFLCTSINLKNMQSENLSNVVPPTSRASNYIALRYTDFPRETSVSS
ncbi:uncharacterized protein E5676_scaffold5G00350 [Cucumis melo var. makuwa]|uniref:Uncharacterized protein n=1 Tax=Cucumis melo var. makuwa TaxID=1194695 RepID=A0A5D3CS26_CUCMM|nr:uncharacterized protein E5676_scaffold5G00350 [Cucumis melo var. makuwa]